MGLFVLILHVITKQIIEPGHTVSDVMMKTLS